MPVALRLRPDNLNTTYHVTHSASPANGYVYMIEFAGGTEQGWLVTGQTGRAWSRLYTLEFEARPAWRTLLLQTPQFFPTQPMPPGYIGRSTEELLTNNPPVTNLIAAVASSYTNLDQSPELPVGFFCKLRVEYPGAIYHFINRGDRREPIFRDDPRTPK